MIEQYRVGSTLSARLAAAPPKNVTGTYKLWFEYCAPTNGAPQGVFQTAHGLGEFRSPPPRSGFGIWTLGPGAGGAGKKI